MYKIDTIFYFCPDKEEYDRENVLEGTDDSPAGIDPRTIVFIEKDGSIYKAGKLYGRMEDTVLIDKIKEIINDNPESLPIATSDTLGAIKVGNSLTMVSSTTQDGPKDTLEIRWSKLINDLANYTDDQGIGLYKDQWIRDIVFDSAKGNFALKEAIDALSSQVGGLDATYATDTDIATLDAKITTEHNKNSELDSAIATIQGRLNAENTGLTGLDSRITTEHNTNESQNTEIANIKTQLNKISSGSDGVSLDSLNGEIAAIKGVNQTQTTDIAGHTTRLDGIDGRLNNTTTGLEALSTRINTEKDINVTQNGKILDLEDWKTAFNQMYPLLENLASDAELQAAIDGVMKVINGLDPSDAAGIVQQLAELRARQTELSNLLNEKLSSLEYTLKIGLIEAAILQMIKLENLTELDQTLRGLIALSRTDNSDEIAEAKNAILGQLTTQWVIDTIKNLFVNWEFIKSLDKDHYPMTWNNDLRSFIQLVVGDMGNDENSGIWSIFEQKYNELLTKIEGITVLTDGEGAVSIDQLVAIIKSYIDTANFESVNEMKTFWAKLKAAYEDKEIDTNDPEWLKKLEEILKNYETYEWVVAGFESRSSEEMNLAQQFAQAQAKNTEHDTAIYQHGQRLTDDEARLAQAEGDIDALELRATTIETNLNAESSARTSAVTDLQNRVSSAESSIGSHTSAIETINTTISTLDGKVTANETNIATLTSDAGLTSDAVSDLKSRMTTAENNLSAKANASNVYTKAEVDGIKEELQENIDGEATLRQNIATDLANYKTTVNTNLNSKANASDVYTKTEIDGKVTTINNSISGEAELRQAVENDLANYKTTVTQNLGAKANVNDVYSKNDIDGKVSTINTNVTAASNLAQEAKNDFSNWKNDETDGYKAFTTSTSNALTSKASVSYVDGIKDNLQGQINDLESGVTTSSDIQGWLDNGTLKLQGNTVAQMYSQIGNDISSAVSTKADSTTVTNLAGEVSSIQSTLSTMSSRIGEVESSVSTAVKKDSNGKITSDIILDSDHVTITAAVIEASGASLTANELHTYNIPGGYSDEVDKVDILNDYVKATHVKSNGEESYIKINPEEVYLTSNDGDIVTLDYTGLNIQPEDSNSLTILNSSKLYLKTGDHELDIHIGQRAVIRPRTPGASTYSGSIITLTDGIAETNIAPYFITLDNSESYIYTAGDGIIGGDLQVAGDTTLGNVNITGSITTKVNGSTIPTGTCCVGFTDFKGDIRYLCFVNGLFAGYSDVGDYQSAGQLVDGDIDQAQGITLNENCW